VIPKREAHDWVDGHAAELSVWHRTIWDFAEPAFREYRSAAWYVELLRGEGFEVEVGTGGMPTAFAATWGEGSPVLATYVEYDAVPGNCQAAVPYRAPRPGLGRFAPGHTDPHSALGIASLGGTLAAKHVMEAHGIPGTLRLYGEPAEKVCASKPVHAANGYYDGLDAAISFHPAYMLPLFNTTRLDIHCGSSFVWVSEFETSSPETWLLDGTVAPIPVAHASVRAPGALDAVVQLYQAVKQLKENLLPATVPWSMNEFVMAGGQATADNLPHHLGALQFILRSPSIALNERAVGAIERTAAAIATITHTEARTHWVAKLRPGLPNHAMARLVYRNLEEAGTPTFDEAAKDFGRAILRELGREPVAEPFAPACSEPTPPEVAQEALRRILPSSVDHFTSDDYVEYTWSCPTARLYVGRPMLVPELGPYPPWVMNALGGHPATIDPMIRSAARTIAGSLVDLSTRPEVLAAAREEFDGRTGGGVGGERWIPPLLPEGFVPPIDLPWPEYVTTPRGDDWWIPRRRDDVEAGVR